MQTFGQQGEDSSSRNIQLKCVGEKLFLSVQKIIRFRERKTRIIGLYNLEGN